MDSELQYVLGFFVPIVVAAGAGFLAGRHLGRKQGSKQPDTIEVRDPVVTLVDGIPQISQLRPTPNEIDEINNLVKSMMGTPPAEVLPAEEFEAVVTTVIPEYGHAKVMTTGRRTFSIGPRVENFDWTTLIVGQKVKITVVDGLVRRAERI